MGHFQNDYQSASADHVEYYGQPISYSDPSRTATAFFDAVCYPEKVQRRQNSHGWYIAYTREISFLVDDLRDARLDGTFTIGGVKYSVEAIGELHGDRIKASVVRFEAAEVNRPGIRGRRQ